MGYFDDAQNVESYLKAAEGHDGALLIERLKALLSAGSTVLELGMGAGKDLALLEQAGFRATGSDASSVFVEKYRKRHGPDSCLLLDAVTLETDQRFGAIYSNKVLHLLTEKECTASLRRQVEVLEPGGLSFHSFWAGEGSEQYGEMRVQLHTAQSLAAQLPAELSVEDTNSYAEMEEGDSFWIALRKAK